MPATNLTPRHAAHPAPAVLGPARLAGLAYLGVVAAGLFSELAVRVPLMAGDPATLPDRLATAAPALRLSLAADTLMVLLDVALALLFFHLLRPVGPGLALGAMALRLLQAATIATALMFQLAAVEAAPVAPETAAWLMRVQGAGYDLGLVFFGVNAFLMMPLLARSGLAPRPLAALIGASGVAYVAGGLTRLAAPELNALMQPAYALPMLAETALALWLLAAPRRRTAQPA